MGQRRCLQHGHCPSRTLPNASIATKKPQGRTHAAFGIAESGLTLAELLTTTRAVQANLFTFNFASIASDVTSM
jgi:hypothetical protein